MDVGTGEHILFLKGGAIGDFILTLPVLAALRRHFPRARLELFGRARTAPLALMAGLADGWQDLEGQDAAVLFVPGSEVAIPLRECLERCMLILCHVPDPEGVLRANLSRLSPARILSGPFRPDETVPRHAAAQFLDSLQALGVADCDPVPHLNGAGAYQRAKSRERVTLAMHPGSGGERKNWPEARWAELLSRLSRETDWNFLLIGGEAEGGRAARLAKLLPLERVVIAEQLPLQELAGRLQACHFFFGHDSGITHLAATLDLPGLALWGETNATVWRPLGGRMEILREPAGLSALAVEKVFHELRARVHFAPMA
jgi:heptosyltransferase-2